MATMLVLHGPSLNLLGQRITKLYGTLSLKEIDAQLLRLALELGHSLTTFQSNSESELINRIHQCQNDQTNFIIFNPAAFTHTSIALRDALLAVEKPFIEVHVSNIYAQESFRHHSYFSDIAIGVISGLGSQGYLSALRYADHYLNSSTKESLPQWTCEKLEN